MFEDRLHYERVTITQHPMFLKMAIVAMQTGREFSLLSIGWRF